LSVAGPTNTERKLAVLDAARSCRALHCPGEDQHPGVQYRRIPGRHGEGSRGGTGANRLVPVDTLANLIHLDLLLSGENHRFAGPERTPIADLPVGYLVDPAETNNDPTNYWIFSATGLDRLVRRAGWTVLDQVSVGEAEQSDPSSPEHVGQARSPSASRRRCRTF
jgi:hypothetical protein